MPGPYALWWLNKIKSLDRKEKKEKEKKWVSVRCSTAVIVCIPALSSVSSCTKFICRVLLANRSECFIDNSLEWEIEQLHHRLREMGSQCVCIWKGESSMLPL